PAPVDDLVERSRDAVEVGRAEPAGDVPGRDRLAELDRAGPVEPEEPRPEPEPDRALEAAVALCLVGIALELARVEPLTAAAPRRRTAHRRGAPPPGEPRREGPGHDG